MSDEIYQLLYDALGLVVVVAVDNNGIKYNERDQIGSTGLITRSLSTFHAIYNTYNSLTMRHQNTQKDYGIHEVS